ncbi:MAG: polyprenyl synthetase family protein [Nitrosopumilales archaeon]|nr:polyprenyl synthetase family protein [Nitrosopumilales archaeon]
MDRKNIEINPLLETYNNYIKKINQVLSSELSMYSESEFKDPLIYAIENGKRIRPLILVLASESVGHADENAYVAGCAVELLHTESVIHDDIIDNETLRRQKDPFHIKYGYNTSILTGDFVLGFILNICAKLNNPRITKDLATTAMLMSEGEMIEGRLETSEDLTFDDYLYGKNIGVAYQIKDDLRDWKNEDKLFNLLVKKSSDPRDVFNHMEVLLEKYSSMANIGLRKIKDSDAKTNLENLIKFTMFKV